MSDIFGAVTVDPDFPRVVLPMSRAFPEDPFELHRTDSSGSRLVRLPTDLDVHQESLTIIDYDAALGPVAYLSWSGELAEVDLTDHHRLPVFSLPSAPTIHMTVPTTTVFDGPRSSPTQLHEVIGRRYPLATIRPLSGRSGRMEVLLRSWQDVKDLEALMELGQVVHYREADNPGMDAYMVIRSTSPRQAGGLWIVAVEWTEVDAPTAGYEVSSWTFDDLRAAHPSFPRVATAYTSFNDLTTGGRL